MKCRLLLCFINLGLREAEYSLTHVLYTEVVFFKGVVYINLGCNQGDQFDTTGEGKKSSKVNIMRKTGLPVLLVAQLRLIVGTENCRSCLES